MHAVPRAILCACLGLILQGVGTASLKQCRAAPGATQAMPLRPDPALTPGATLPVTKDDICVPGYTQKVRNVPLDVKRQVYAEYGITQHRSGDYEVDHLISLELGGSNSVKNLWPQSYRTQPWNAHVKDALENELHAEVCSGTLDLAAAQHEIATDWIVAYRKHFHTRLPLSSAASSRRSRRHRYGRSYADRSVWPSQSPTALMPTPSGNGAQVWVNLRSGKYFLPGSRYYGNTQHGTYLSEAQALKMGYIAAKGR